MAAVKKLKPAALTEPAPEIAVSARSEGQTSKVRQKASQRATGSNVLLGVTHSARGNVWRDRLAPGLVNTAAAISQQHGLPELLGRVLAARGVTPDTVPVFLDPTIKALMPDPSAFTAMDKATARLADAIERREPVAIFGDYDVDGACSSALLSRFLSHHGVPARIYIPDRATEGYGPNKNAIEGLIKEGAKLIVTVDCGTTSGGFGGSGAAGSTAATAGSPNQATDHGGGGGGGGGGGRIRVNSVNPCNFSGVRSPLASSTQATCR